MIITDQKNIILSVRNLAVTFKIHNKQTLRAVDNVNFDLKKGSILGLVGESGCGKSVTSQAIMRLLPQPSGSIAAGSILYRPQFAKGSKNKGTQGRDLEGEIDLATYPARYLHHIRGNRIAMIFQDSMSALNPVHKIGRQILEVFKLHYSHLPLAEMKQRSIELFRQVEIPDPEQRMEAFPHQLSGGMRQRVMIAIALAAEPDILIADEPTTALDVTVQYQILSLIRELRQNIGMSVIFITHDMGVISEMCDDVVVMYAGRVAEQGPVRSILSGPAHPYTQGLMSSIPHFGLTPKSSLPVIEGTVPSLYEMPQGCRFSNRCELASDRCVKQPDLFSFATEHHVACHYVENNRQQGEDDG